MSQCNKCRRIWLFSLFTKLDGNSKIYLLKTTGLPVCVTIYIHCRSLVNILMILFSRARKSVSAAVVASEAVTNTNITWLTIRPIMSHWHLWRHYVECLKFGQRHSLKCRKVAWCCWNCIRVYKTYKKCCTSRCEYSAWRFWTNHFIRTRSK